MPSIDQAILDYIAAHPYAGREDIRRNVAPDVSPPTVWRALRRLIEEGRVEVSGKARATRYGLAGSAAVRAHLQTPYNRRRLAVYEREFIDRYVPGKSFYLNEAARERLHAAGRPLSSPLPAGTYARRILEQLLVDLSWASSRLEGNTYDILQTERLIRFGEEAVGKDRREAVMILNHKEAIEYVVDHLADITISRMDVLGIHALLADGLLIDPAMAGQLRRMPVGISRSSYRPLDDPFVIEEEFDLLIRKAERIGDPFEQSFFLLLHIPYLQAFSDVNKRTSRVVANVPLLKADLAPLSFVTMDDADYVDGLIGVYEVNNVALLREIYVDAYLASAENYRVLRADLESPSKAALVYRDFVRGAVRRNVLEWRDFRRSETATMAAEAGVPDADREQVVEYIGNEIRSLHEGNAIRYRLSADDLAAMKAAMRSDGGHDVTKQPGQ